MLPLLVALLSSPVAELRGTDFAGGANRHYGSDLGGRGGVNYVYAAPNGAESRMEASFELTAPPAEPLFWHLLGLDDDGPEPCRVELSINGVVVFLGESEFTYPAWTARRYAVPAGALRVGRNVLSIRNVEPAGPIGNLPWFAVALAAVAGPEHALRPPPLDPARDLSVLPAAAAEPFPEPLPDGRAPGFAVRMVKGWHWTPEQYLEVLPDLRRLKLTHLMLCYTSTFPDYPAWTNEWWRPLPDALWKAIARLQRACVEQGIELVFSAHPQFAAPRAMDPASPADRAAFFDHYQRAQALGIRWFTIQFDDVGPSLSQFACVNALFALLRAGDPRAELVFCPTWYWGDGGGAEASGYNERLAAELHPEVYLFWTGDAVVTPRITRACLAAYRERVRHRIIIWDNYPVNDAAPTLHLGPLTGRDPGLHELAEGYLSNAMSQQHRVNAVPLATMADYAYNPWAYDPARSIGRATALFGRTAEQRAALAELIEAYPGMIQFAAGTGFNPVRQRLRDLLEARQPKFVAAAYVARLEGLLARFERAFGERFADARATLGADVRWARAQLAERYGPPPAELAGPAGGGQGGSLSVNRSGEESRGPRCPLPGHSPSRHRPPSGP